jgi:hypothetical protein
MDARSILLQVEQESGEGSYSFDCPSCELPVEKPADHKIVLLLMSAGVEVMEAQETPSPETRPEGPAFTSDDLIDFHFLLQQTNWFEQLVADAK